MQLGLLFFAHAGVAVGQHQPAALGQRSHGRPLQVQRVENLALGSSDVLPLGPGAAQAQPVGRIGGEARAVLVFMHRQGGGYGAGGHGHIGNQPRTDTGQHCQHRPSENQGQVCSLFFARQRGGKWLHAVKRGLVQWQGVNLRR